MTYIEFFDKIASENISACLTYTPDRVIYIGDSKKQMNKHMAYYRRVFADRGVNIDFSCRTVSKSNLESAVKVLTDLVEEYDDCVFDITGGEEILTLALGVVYAQNPGKNIQIHIHKPWHIKRSNHILVIFKINTGFSTDAAVYLR